MNLAIIGDSGVGKTTYILSILKRKSYKTHLYKPTTKITLYELIINNDKFMIYDCGDNIHNLISYQINGIIICLDGSKDVNHNILAYNKYILKCYDINPSIICLPFYLRVDDNNSIYKIYNHLNYPPIASPIDLLNPIIHIHDLFMNNRIHSDKF